MCLKDKIRDELSWICSGETQLDILLALSGLISEYSDRQLIEKEVYEKVRLEEYERARQDFDSRLKKAMEIK